MKSKKFIRNLKRAGVSFLIVYPEGTVELSEEGVKKAIKNPRKFREYSRSAFVAQMPIHPETEDEEPAKKVH